MTPRLRAAAREFALALLEEVDEDAVTVPPKSAPRVRRVASDRLGPPVSELDAARAKVLLRRKGIYVDE